MIRFLCLLLLVCAAPGLAYYHLLSERVFSLDNPNADFGFSITSFSSSSKTKLVVGAPLADNIGQVYTCDLNDNDGNTCTSAKRTIKRFTENENYNNQSYWYGATVRGTDDFFVACAPMLIDKDIRDLPGSKNVGTFGRCYKYTGPDAAPELLSTLTKVMRTKNDKDIKFEKTIDSLGWCADIQNDDSVVVGGPAMITGRVIKIEKNSVQYASGDNKKISFNFGYSVASGRFMSPKQTIAVGTTYGFEGYGKVSFLTEKMRQIKELKSPVVGSMFGAVLCTATLGGARTQGDLLVGAPAYGDKETFNRGAVYVYISKKSAGQAPYLVNVIYGKISSSFFGSAIASVGDLNGDKIDEIAIAAPYENNHGAVYLYSGAHMMKDGLVPIQTITPENSISTFGFSLTALKDYDDNGCNELAIGIPESNKVKVLKCMASITIKLHKFDVQIPGNNGKDTTRELPVCYTVEFPVKPALVTADIKVDITITHYGARLNDPTKDGSVMFNIRDKLKTKDCKNITLFMNGTAGDYNKKIHYKIVATLLNDPSRRTEFAGSDVRLSERSVLSESGSIWVQECGSKLCTPNLEMNTSFTHESPYTIGSTPFINASVSVTNKGDVAYDACVRVDVSGASVPRPPSGCRPTGDSAADQLECKPTQLLRTTNSPWNIEDISLNTSSLTNLDKLIEINVTLYNECSTSKLADQITRQIVLFADPSSVNVQGHTDGVDDLVNLTRNEINDKATFQHVYMISNSGGTTNWADVNIALVVPKLDYVTVAAVSVDNKECNNFKETDTEATYSCKADKLYAGAGIQAKVKFQVVPDELNGIIGKEKLTVRSDIILDLDGTPKNTSVISELKLQEGQIPIWIIIAASILALIILVIIFFILKECGFLKRKNKEELKRVRMSVRRQTVMRQSMMNRPRSEDQDKLVDEASSSQDAKKKKKDRRVVVNDF